MKRRNSPQAVEALTFYRNLSKFAPAAAANFSFEEVNGAMQQGPVAVPIQWVAFFGGFIDPEAAAAIR